MFKLKQTYPRSERLLPGLFRERAELNRAYLMELKTENLLQNFYLEAAIRTDRGVEEMHGGWESPVCQLRGHFLGHWLSAAAMLIASENDRELKAKHDIIIEELQKCQKRNGGRWIGSVPEKYFEMLERGEYIWSPQYTLHKTLLGLYHSALYAENKTALEILDGAAEWYLDWTAKMERMNPHAIYSGEEGGMLEVWAGLYQLTDKEIYLTLAKRYSKPNLFERLENGEDPLSDNHANASIPWAHGAAKMYEVTGEEKWLNIVKRFWECAVDKREAFCTGGQNSGEFWIAPGRLGAFLEDRTQEFCTVYNMVRLADYLLRITGEKKYGDYIEKNLYNGFLAQQNKHTGMPAYFLPLKAGSRKKWGSKTHDFWCCHGTMVQAQTIYPMLCQYEDTERDRTVISQYINCEYKRSENVTITQSADMKYYGGGAFFDEHDESSMSRWSLKITVAAKSPERFTLSLRVPDWVSGEPIVLVNGEKTALVIIDGYINLERTWSADTVNVYFPATVSVTALPDEPQLMAFSEGPIVLAGLCGSDRAIRVPDLKRPETVLVNVTQHTYGTFPWQQSVYRTTGQDVNFELVPIYDIADESYTVYFTVRE